MTRIEEANLSKAMDFTFNHFIEPLLSQEDKETLAYRPVTQKDNEWLRDNPATGIIYLSKHPNAKEAWVLVKFEQRTDKKFGQHAKYGSNIKITNVDEFKNFFGVEPSPDFNWNDKVIYVRWDKTVETNPYAYRDFDETTPNFYMYTNHRKVNLETLVKRLLRINEIIETDPKAISGNMFNIPYSATNIK